MLTDITGLADSDLDSLLPLAPIGRTPWTELDDEDRDAFIAAIARFLIPVRKYERAYYKRMWRRGFSEARYAAVACSDEVHAQTAHEYGRLSGLTHEQMLAEPWTAVDAMLAYM